MIPPFSLGYTKGWKRAVMALICLQGVRELELEDEVSHAVKASIFVNYV